MQFEQVIADLGQQWGRYLLQHIGQVLNLAVTLVAGGFSLFVWSRTQREKARQRDHELFDWGSAVIETMSEIEMVAAEPSVLARRVPRERLLALKARASALIDQGRLFFPNVTGPGRRQVAAAYEGHRIAILDEVVRAFVIAQHLADHAPKDDGVLKVQMRAARRRFVRHLQREMGQSLRRPAVDQAGTSVPENPYDWD